jgi:hypothetical protein
MHSWLLNSYAANKRKVLEREGTRPFAAHINRIWAKFQSNARSELKNSDFVAEIALMI